MKVILASALVALGLAVAAGFVLSAQQRTAYEAYSTNGTRLAEPGENLVGGRWNGQPDAKGNHGAKATPPSS